MRGQFLPFSPPAISEQEISEVVDTLRSNWITTGPKVKQFESKFAEFVGTHGALGVSSCTDALQVALAALGVGPGDVVLTTTLTFLPLRMSLSILVLDRFWLMWIGIP